MRRGIFTAVLWVFAGFFPLATTVFAAEEAAAESEPAAAQKEICQHFLEATSDLWFLLSGIRDKEDADRSVDRFISLVHRICSLDEDLSRVTTATGLPLEVEEEVEGRSSKDGSEELEQLQIRILESFDDINSEFIGLCRTRCYGSDKLRQAFRDASESGMFAEEGLALLADPPKPYNESESREEIARLRRLADPDRTLLNTLKGVHDAASAAAAVQELHHLQKQLAELRPPTADCRAFTQREEDTAKATMEDIEPLLWNIRAELVRIAGLPGYDNDAYNDFSDALDGVYEKMSETHRDLFDYVFDASFRTDLDAALQESLTSFIQ